MSINRPKKNYRTKKQSEMWDDTTLKQLNGMIQLYRAQPRHSMIATGKGDLLSYIEWLHKEEERIRRDPERNTQIAANKLGNVSLWANDVSI